VVIDEFVRDPDLLVGRGRPERLELFNLFFIQMPARAKGAPWLFPFLIHGDCVRGGAGSRSSNCSW
jgi:hypothetical protein